MAVFAYLKFTDIKGECQDANHKEEVEVLSWNHSSSQPTSAVRSTAGGGTVEKVNHGDFTFTKYIDSATDDLLKCCWTGKHITTATFTAYRSTGDPKNPVKYLEVIMTGVVVSSFSIGGGSGDLAVENIALNYAKIKYAYIKQKSAEGTADTGVEPVEYNMITDEVA